MGNIRRGTFKKLLALVLAGAMVVGVVPKWAASASDMETALSSAPGVSVVFERGFFPERYEAAVGDTDVVFHMNVTVVPQGKAVASAPSGVGVAADVPLVGAPVDVPGVPEAVTPDDGFAGDDGGNVVESSDGESGDTSEEAPTGWNDATTSNNTTTDDGTTNSGNIASGNDTTPDNGETQDSAQTDGGATDDSGADIIGSIGAALGFVPVAVLAAEVGGGDETDDDSTVELWWYQDNTRRADMGSVTIDQGQFGQPTRAELRFDTVWATDSGVWALQAYDSGLNLVTSPYSLNLAVAPIGITPASITSPIDFRTFSSNQSGPGWEWTYASRTLTLTNFVMNVATTASSIILPVGSTVVLVGDNTVSNNAGNGNGIMVLAGNNEEITIRGSGALTVTVPNVPLIFGGSSVRITDGAELILTSTLGSYVIVASQGITINGNSNVTTTAGVQGLSSTAGNVTITDSSVTINASASGANGIDASNGNVTITNSNVNITADGVGINTPNGTTIITYGLVRVNGDVTGGSVNNADITILGGPFTYNGSAHTPSFTVSQFGVPLAANTYFTYSFANNTNVGTATLTITGVAPLGGTATADFTILAAQTLEQARAAAQAAVDAATVSNATTAADIMAAATGAITNSAITAAWTDAFDLAPATTSAPGSITGAITLTLGSGTAVVTVDREIAQLVPEQQVPVFVPSPVEPPSGRSTQSHRPGTPAFVLQKAMAATRRAVSEVSATASNSTTAESILGAVQSVMPQGASAGWSSNTTFTLTPAEVGQDGQISGIIIIAVGPYASAISLNITIPALAATTRTFILQLDSHTITDQDGNTIAEMDVLPIIQDGRTLIPVRFISEALGASVSWNDNTREVTLAQGGESLTFAIGETAPGMDIPAQIINDRTMVPLRFISEFFGAEVQWHETTRTIQITR